MTIKKDGLPPLETWHGAQRRVMALFLEIAHHHGVEKTRAIFAECCQQTPHGAKAAVRDYELLRRLDAMKPKRNIKKFARKLKDEGAKQSQESIERRLRLLRNQRRKKPSKLRKDLLYEFVWVPITRPKDSTTD
jgi:hypothetical protein